MRKFRFKGDPEEYKNLVEKGLVYEEDYQPDVWSIPVITLFDQNPEDWQEVLEEDSAIEEAFINQCAIAAMKAFISSPERFPEALDLVNIPALAFNVAEEMNEERKKRLKKSSS